jgi:hypothetical protein
MMELKFGRFKGMSLSDPAVPDTYVEWLAKRGSYTLQGNRFETTWKVPIVLSIEARREMEHRGYEHDGDRWRKIYWNNREWEE